PGFQAYEIAGRKSAPGQISGIELDRGPGRIRKQHGERAGTTHPVPLVAQPSGVQAEGKARVDTFGDRDAGHRGELRATVGSREAMIGVQAGTAFRLAFGTWPLLRADGVKAWVRQSSDVEIAAAGSLRVLREDRRRRCVRK